MIIFILDVYYLSRHQTSESTNPYHNAIDEMWRSTWYGYPDSSYDSFLRRFILVQCKIKKMSAAILGYGLASILADINLTRPVPLSGWDNLKLKIPFVGRAHMYET